jgi:hypothetical protein
VSRVCVTRNTYPVHLVAVYVYKWFYVANTVDGNWLDLWINVLVNSIVIVPFMVNAFMKQEREAPEAEFSDEIQTKVFIVSSLLFIVTSTSLSLDFNFFKFTQPLHASTVQCTL